MIALALAAAALAQAGPVFQESGGIVVIPVESAPAVAPWQSETAIAGYTGSGYHAWRSPDSMTVGSQILQYRFRITTPGTYTLALRSWNDSGAGSLAYPSVYARVDNVTPDGIPLAWSPGGWWSALRDTGANQRSWHWSTVREGPVPITYTLAAGDHVFEMTGRKEGMCYDRVHFYLGGVANPLDASLPPSFTLGGGPPPPQPSPAPAPGAGGPTNPRENENGDGTINDTLCGLLGAEALLGLFLLRRLGRRTRAVTIFVLLLPAGSLFAQNESNPGRWEGPYEIGFRMTHSAVIPTGHLLAVNSNQPNHQAVWDPATKTVLFRPVVNGNVFCSGHAMMADGRLLVAGGEAGADANGNPIGIASAEAYVPTSQQWVALPNMPGGERWYPTAVALPDGQVMVWNGISRGATNPWVDFYNPSSNTWTTVSNRTYRQTYPRLHVLLTGVVFTSGGAEPLYFNASTRAWTTAPAPNLQDRGEGMNSVLLPFSAQAASQKVLVLGGGTGTAPASSAETFTFTSSGSGTWQTIPSMSQGRVNANSVLLPSGEVFVVGGTLAPPGQNWDNLESAEIYSPSANAWRTAAPMRVGRGYHSGALLLPDGSVAVGGGEIQDANGVVLTRFTDLEVYFPWYFTAPSRPSITSAPAEAGYGGTLAIGSPNTDISKVYLIRASSTTHSLNTDQRAVELSFTASGGTITAQTPSSPNLAPPGYYMLFLRNTTNVPSTARWVKLTPNPSTLPTVTVMATDAGASEPGSNTGTFTITRSGSTSASLAVSFAVTGSAGSGTDYASLGSAITIPAGSPSATLTVTPTDDGAAEPDETVIVTLTSSSAYTVGSPGSATVTIADNDTPAVAGLTGRYYDNLDFTGATTTRTDPTVNFYWASGSPAPGISPFTFSVRWTGQVLPQYGELYTFYANTNDGVRLWVNGELIIDQWVPWTGTEYAGSVALLAGKKVTLQMDYYQNLGNAGAELRWSSASLPKQIVPQAQLDSASSPADGRDNDSDGVANDQDPDDDNDGVPDLQDADRDGDGAGNAVEDAAGTDPDDRNSVPAGGGGGGGNGGCGATGLEVLIVIGLFCVLRRGTIR